MFIADISMIPSQKTSDGARCDKEIFVARLHCQHKRKYRLIKGSRLN
jgi:hypothetical protein